MISMMLSNAANKLQAELIGNDVLFNGCSTDSRTVKPGELFIALRGEQFDGHDYVGLAGESGAAAAMVDTVTEKTVPLLMVGDTRLDMGRLAGCWRDNFNIPVIAVTGSNGKTTVKEMVSNILSIHAPVISTTGNLNNDIGVPLTLFNMDQEHDFAVIEIGANHPGEISYLSRIVKPDVAVITQCAPAHLEGFGSIDGVARAKAEIYGGLSDNGVAVINNDDDYADFWLDTVAGREHIKFGFTSDADVFASDVSINADKGTSLFRIHAAAESIEINLELPGEHNIQNALAAAACCLAVKIPLKQIRQGLEKTRSFKGRLQFKKGIHGSCIVDDTYNANPVSLEVAMNHVTGRDGRYWLVLGDMGELGPDSENLHTLAGEKARELGFEKLFALGALSKNSVAGFGNGARHFEDADSLVSQLRVELDGDVTLLVKGSRAMSMENIVTALEIN